jgi:hypothetical protein
VRNRAIPESSLPSSATAWSFRVPNCRLRQHVLQSPWLGLLYMAALLLSGFRRRFALRSFRFFIVNIN